MLDTNMMPKLLLKILRKRGIRLFAKNGRLCLKDPEGTLTWALGNEILKYKTELLDIVGKPKAEILRMIDYQ